MKKVLLILVALAGAYYVLYELDPAADFSSPASSIDAPATKADAQWRSGQQVRATGTVSRILPDDNDGSRHQRFILRLSSGRTLLIAHNIDLAPRVSSLQTGDTVSFYGEYVSNDRGGVIHWTHHDPQGRHADGWLEHKGRRYQ
jgi:hypothetical protein